MLWTWLTATFIANHVPDIPCAGPSADVDQGLAKDRDSSESVMNCRDVNRNGQNTRQRIVEQSVQVTRGQN